MNLPAIIRRRRSGVSPLAIYAVLGIRPELVLDFDDEKYFANSSRTTFSDAITHSASSNATMVDSDGLLKWRSHNLVTYSEQFDNAAWIKNGTAVTANAGLAPDGSVTADRVEGTTSTKLLYTPVTVSAGQKVTLAIWAKSFSEVSQEFSFFADNNQASNDKIATSEWQLFTFEVTIAVSGARNFGIVDNAAGDTYDILVWGAHLYRSDLGGMVAVPADARATPSATTYVPTTSSAVYLPRRGHHVYNGTSWVNEGLLHESEARTNAQTYSQDAAQWTVTDGTLTASQVASPLGLNTGHLYEEGVGIGSHRVIFPSHTVSAFAGCAQVLVKANGAEFIAITPVNSGGAGNSLIYFFDFTGATPSYAGYATYGGALVGGYIADFVEDMGDGWWRISIAFTTTVTGSTGAFNVAAFSSYPGQITLLPQQSGDGTSGFYLACVQLEYGAATPSSYIPTSGATVTRAAETLTIPSATLPWPTPNVIGPELVTNGDGSDVTGWTVTAPVTQTVNVSEQFVIERNLGAITDFPTQTILTAGKTYLVSFDVAVLSDSVSAYLGDGTAQLLATGTGTWEGVVVATGADFFIGPTGATNATCTIDNISVREIDPLAVSIQMQGRMTYADEGDALQVYLVRWVADSGNFIQAVFATDGAKTGEFRTQQRALSAGGITVDSADDYYSPGINVPFNIASRHGSTFINGAVDGTALTADLTPTALPDLSATDLQLGFDYMGTIKLFRIWADDLGDSGIAEASIPWLVSSGYWDDAGIWADIKLWTDGE